MNTQTYTTKGVLGAFKAARTICPVAFNAIGTLPCQMLIYLYYMLEVIFEEHAANLPVAFRALESAQATRDMRVSIPGSAPRPAPPGLVTTYGDHSVAELREQAGRTKATRGLADKYGRLPAIERLGNGCCQQPEYGAGIYTANYQTVSESYAPALLRTRDSERIAKCRDAGYRILARPEISMLRYANAGGSTGNGAEPQDAMLGKRNAADLGLRLNQHLFLFLPSVSNSVNPTAARENAGKLLLEVLLAMECPEKIVLNTLDGQQIRYTDGPIYDTVTCIGVTTEFLATVSRDELAARTALLALAFITTPLLSLSEEKFADSKAQTDRRHGLALLRRLGFTRFFLDSQRSQNITREAMVEEALRTL